jgi:hypothetical protein
MAMTLSRRLALAAAALLLPAAATLHAEKEMTTLQIEVKTAENRPIDRASVIVKFVQGRSKAKLGRKIKTSWELRTNQQGIAKIPPIPQGRILVQVVAKGYQTHGKTYEVEEEEKTLEIKLNSPQSQYSVHTN